jgi:hypothetical protein
MNAMVGDDILIDSEKAGTPPREGQILEVLERSYGTLYRVLWQDGHETTVHPVAGTVRIEHHEKPAKERHCSSDIESADCTEALAEVWR